MKPLASACASACAIVMACASLTTALVGDWTSYTYVQSIRDLKVAKGLVFAATAGGVRKINPANDEEKTYRNQQGLRDVGINALAVSPEGTVFAASELGFLYRYDWVADTWEVLGTSYKGAGWRMNKRAMAYRAGYLVLGSDKGLSFFNVKRKIAEANVSKMATASGFSVNSLLFQGDTLFAGTGVGIFRAVLHLDKLLSDPQVNIFNPGIWTEITKGGLFYDPVHPDPAPGDTNPPVMDTSRHMPAENDAAKAHGMLFYTEKGIASEFDGMALTDPPAKISRYSSVMELDGKPFRNPFGLQALAFAGGHWYLGHANNMFRFQPANEDWKTPDIFYPLTSADGLPLHEIISTHANRYGVFGWAVPLVYQLHGNRWDSVAFLSVPNDAVESKRRGLHSFAPVGPQDFLVGNWGGGYTTLRSGTETHFDAVNSCLRTADAKDPNFPAVQAQAPYRDKGYFIGMYSAFERYRLAYYDLASGKISCFEPQNRDKESHSVSVVGDSVLAVVTEQGLEAYRIKDNGGLVSLETANLLTSLPSTPEPTLAGQADRRGNFWVTTEGTRMLFVPALQYKADTGQAFHSLEGFSGTACHNLEIDKLGHLWTGCTEGGVFEITPGRDSVSHAFRKYGLNDGVLSEVIYNLSVNPDNGDIWVTTEKGLARYESASRPVRSDLSDIKVYPNPFLSKHAQVVFDGLSAGSEVQVLTQSGSVVYHRSLTSGGAGDQIRWDGRNQGGERVREGVYFWVARSPKETRHGKIIVAR